MKRSHLLAEVRWLARRCPVIHKWWRLDFTQPRQSDFRPKLLNTVLATSMRNKITIKWNLHS